jgi:DNA-binding CsgD family transcriptional regulator
MGAPSEERWLSSVTEAVSKSLGFASGVFGFSYQVRDDGWIEIQAVSDMGTPPGFTASVLQFDGTSKIGSAFGRVTGLVSAVSGLRRVLLAEEFESYYAHGFLPYGVKDLLVLNAFDPTRSGCFVGQVSDYEIRRAPHRSRWIRVAAHVAAGLRLRRKLHVADSSHEAIEPQAVLTPSGRVEHATGTASMPSARERLRTAALAADRARGPLRHKDPDEALQIWRGLVAGQWSLVDWFDTDGRRYVIAHENAPLASDPRALTERERQVAGFAALGHSNKVIAYELGLSPSTVGVLLARAKKKLDGSVPLPIQPPAESETSSASSPKRA